ASLDAAGATAAFDGTVAVSGALNTAAAGLTTFDNAVTAGSVATGAVALDGGSVATSAGQSYGAAMLIANTMLTDTDHSAIAFRSTVGSVEIDDLRPSLTVADAGGAVTFDGAVTISGALNMTASGLTTFNSGVEAGSVQTGVVALDGGSVMTSAGQTYGVATLGADAVLADSGRGAITFASTLDGAHSLTVSDFGGAIAFEGAVGRSTALTNLTATGASIAFTGSLALGGNLDTSAVDLTTFDGSVTAASVRTAAAALDGGSVTSTNGQYYGAASDIAGGSGGPGTTTLGADTVLHDSGGAILFGGALDGAHSLTIADVGGSVTFTGAIGGATRLSSVTATAATAQFDDSVAVSGALNAGNVGLTTFASGVTAESLAAGRVEINGGTVTTTGNQIYGGGLSIGGDTTLASTAGTITFGGYSPLDTAFALNVLAGGNIDVVGGVQNAGTGAMTLIAGWDGVTPAALAATTPGAYGNRGNGGNVVIGGAGATGDATFGSAGGTTTVAAANLAVAGVNGYAQLGFNRGGDPGAVSGAIDVTLTGDLTLSGGAVGGAYAQIGHGGLATAGSDSGTITIAAGGDVSLLAGSGVYAYAQIGHGGAVTNQSATSLFSDTGTIDVTGNTVTLAGGSGAGAYAQIGQGGIGAGAFAATNDQGSIDYSGSITVAAVTRLNLAGASTTAYAQIGNGGYRTNDQANLAKASITEQGDITVTAGTENSNGALTILGDAYAQIGNGGNAANLNATVPGGITESGNIDVTVLGSGGVATLTGDITNPTGYAQIGNGDAAKTNVGVAIDVGGDINIDVNGPYVLPPHTPNASIWNSIWCCNVTGTTTLNGTIIPVQNDEVTVALPPPALPSSVSLTSLLLSYLSSFSDASLLSGVTQTADTLGQSLNAIAPSSGGHQSKGPIEALTDSSGTVTIGGGGSALPGGSSGSDAGSTNQEADSLTNGIARSMSGTPGTLRSAAALVPQSSLIAGLLTESQAALSPRDTPQAVRPADELYSSWGNEALWDWR
ncbi:MAG TPA: hypothetical protein VMU87_05035, partial [Stellaceae bacterium]|nr:hypothetical protein [Stellaceae bacterium]